MRREGSVADGFQIFSIDGQREILRHADSYLKQGPEPELKSNEFQTPPRPVTSSEKTEALPPLPSFPVAEQEEDQEDVMSAAIARWRNLGPGVLSKEAIHTIGAAFEVDPEHLAQRYGAPSDPGVPPGLGTYSKLASGVES